MLFGIHGREVSMDRRGFFTGVPGMQERLEACAGAFVRGYHLALCDAGIGALGEGLAAVPRDICGFAHEGAAMGLALLDRVTPWNRNRFADYLGGPGAPHCYMAHVGAGWVMARIPGSPGRFLQRLDPLLRWLAADGYGFHEGFFHTNRCTAGEPAPARLKGYARRAFDEGLGRSFWFIHGGDVRRIMENVRRFPASRRGELWSGIGLAATYAAGVSVDRLAELVGGAEAWRPQLAQGAAFAAKARLRAGNASSDTETACHVLCELSASEAAAITDKCLDDLPADAAEPAYEVWRIRIQEYFAPNLITS